MPDKRAWESERLGDDENPDIITHKAPNEENIFFRNVCEGNLDAIAQNCRERRFLSNDGVGRLSRNPLINLQRHFVITAALLARNCAVHGLEHERSFRLSDFYINKLDDCKTVDDVRMLHDRMVLDYTRRMRLLNRNFTTSKPVNDCLNYIYIHINDRLTIEEIADAVHVSPAYLSRVFKKEVGTAVSSYIREKKVDAAANLLIYSDYDIVDIAMRLGFSSQSHFIQTFKKYTGLTPKKYRDSNGRF